MDIIYFCGDVKLQTYKGTYYISNLNSYIICKNNTNL